MRFSRIKNKVKIRRIAKVVVTSILKAVDQEIENNKPRATRTINKQHERIIMGAMVGVRYHTMTMTTTAQAHNITTLEIIAEASKI